MAWIPTPEVAAARDFGNKFGFDQVIVLHRNSQTGFIGYASWGKTRALCDDAKTLADQSLEAMEDMLFRRGLGDR